MLHGIGGIVGLVLGAALAAAPTAWGGAADDLVVKVMSFNIRTSYAQQDRAARCSNWDGERKGNVVGQFKSVGADFVGTQETATEQKNYLDGVLKDTYQSIGKSSGSFNGAAEEWNAIYYKFQDWKPLSDGMFWLGPNPEAPSVDWGMKYYRTCVYGRFEHIKTGETVCVFNTHYETPGNDLAQSKGSEIIMAKATQLCQPGDKLTVLTGDFNALKSYPAMQKLFAANWKDPSDQGTFCGDMNAPGCGDKFDFTLAQIKDGACHVKSEVIRQDFTGCYPSDHAVLVAQYCLKGSCCSGSTPDATQATNNATSAPPTSSSSSSKSGAGSTSVGEKTTRTASNEAEVIPGKVVAGDGPVASPAASSEAPKASGASSTEAGKKEEGGARMVSTKSDNGGSKTTGTLVAIIGVLGVVGAVVGFVLKKKRGLDAQLDDNNKSGLAPIPSLFTRAEEDALSPRPNSDSVNRKYSSPVPTLELNGDDRNRSFSQSSSIPCSSRRSSIPLADRYDSMGRLSSPALLDRRSSNSDRGSSRIYFSEVVAEQSLTNTRADFALL